MALVGAQVLHHVFLLPQFSIEEFLIGLEFSTEPLVGIADMLGLTGNPRREGLVDLALNIVPVELRLALGVLFELAANIFVDALALHFNRGCHLVKYFFLFGVHFFDLTVASTEGP